MSDYYCKECGWEGCYDELVFSEKGNQCPECKSFDVYEFNEDDYEDYGDDDEDYDDEDYDDED